MAYLSLKNANKNTKQLLIKRGIMNDQTQNPTPNYDLALARTIDHTLLKPDATKTKIEILCKEALEYHFASVCINPSYVKQCASLLTSSDVKVCTVIGFPLGATTTESKVCETKNAIENGATEVDMVLNVGILKSGDLTYIENDIRSVAEAAHEGGALLKVILETCLLTDEEKIIACKVAKNAKADFVKTSTGFSTGGATRHDIELMRKIVGPNMGVKASGGIHSREEAEAMLAAGATRIGASAGVKIVNGDVSSKTEKGY